MNIKTIVLSALGAFCILYIIVLQIYHQVEKGKSSCGKDSCVRFCHKTNFTLNQNITQFQKLSKNFGLVVNDLCNLGYSLHGDDDEDVPENFIDFEFSKVSIDIHWNFFYKKISLIGRIRSCAS